MSNRIPVSLALLGATLLLAACGGGGGGGGSQVAGIDRLGVSTGTVTGFGSIFVNGVEWEIATGTVVRVDDNPGLESDLKVGQVVTVRGKLNAAGTAGTADSVEFDNSVEGPVASINLPAGTFVVLSQTVVVNADTVFDDSIPDDNANGRRDLGDLQANDVVEVSGFRDSTGRVLATHVELRAGGGGEIEVKGAVTGLDTGAKTFFIGGLTVDYSSALLQEFGSDTLSNGDIVEVRGGLAAGNLVATAVEREDSSDGDSGDDGEVEGYVTRFVSLADFDVAGVPVTTDGGTQYEGGTSAAVQLNVKVEVEGEFNASGVLVADKVQIRIQPDSADVEIEADVDNVNFAAGTVTLQGMNITVRVSATTQLEDKSNADVEDFALDDLVSGDHVEIRGAEDLATGAGNDMIATRLERDNASNRVELRGAIQAEVGSELTVLGVTITTGAAAFRDLNDNSISPATFFATVAGDDVVKATTDAVSVGGNVLDADQLEIEELAP